DSRQEQVGGHRELERGSTPEPGPLRGLRARTSRRVERARGPIGDPGGQIEHACAGLRAHGSGVLPAHLETGVDLELAGLQPVSPAEGGAEVEPGDLTRRGLGAAKAIRRLRVPEAKEGQGDRVARAGEEGGAQEKLLGSAVPRGEARLGSGEASAEGLEGQGKTERWTQRSGE